MRNNFKCLKILLFMPFVSSLLFVNVVVALSDSASASQQAIRRDGYYAQKLDQYYSAIECMATIVDVLLPEPNTLTFCCGIWFASDMLGEMVAEKCYAHGHSQVKNMTQPMGAFMDDFCSDYPRDSFTCRLLVLMPFSTLFILLAIISVLTYCTIGTGIKLRHYKRLYDNGVYKQLDSCETIGASSNETIDEKVMKMTFNVNVKPMISSV